MYTELTGNASFWATLLEIDRKLLDIAIDGACIYCGGALHLSHYPRKVRGLDAAADAWFGTRFSTCCGRCRRRHTPLSVRFMGRRLFAFVVVVLASMEAAASCASARTLKRWRTYWTEHLPCLAVWRLVQSRFVPGLEVEQLPKSLVERCEPTELEQSAQGLLRALAMLLPLSRWQGELTVFDGGLSKPVLTQSMLILGEYQGLLQIRSASELNS